MSGMASTLSYFKLVVKNNLAGVCKERLLDFLQNPCNITKKLFKEEGHGLLEKLFGYLLEGRRC